MYTAFPFFLVVNASYGGWLLDPVLEFASSSRWNNPYAPRDIGKFKETVAVQALLMDAPQARATPTPRETPTLIIRVLNVSCYARDYTGQTKPTDYQKVPTCSSCYYRMHAYPAMDRISRAT